MSVLRLTASVTREDGAYVAQCLEVDIASQGETEDEALANLREALALRFEDEPPPPHFGAPVIRPIELQL